MSDETSRPPKLPRPRRERVGPASAVPDLPAITPGDALRYAAETLGELARLVRTHDFGTLAYIIEIAQLQAQSELEASGIGEAPAVRRARR